MAAHSSLGCVTTAYIPNKVENANFEWDPEREKTLQQVQAAEPLVPYDPAHGMTLELSGDAIWSLWQDFRGELWKCLVTSEQGSSSLIETILTLGDSYWHANGYQCKLKV